MKINYKLIKKIHSYACLATVALLLMFIFTSYLMIYHDWFDNEGQTDTKIVDLAAAPASEEEWSRLATQYRIFGRLTGTQTNPVGEVIRNYATAAGSTRLTYQPDQGRMEITHTDKSKANAIIGIHRQRGYGEGPLQYNLYALLLDVLAVSLIVFTITGIIMWFRLLKNDKWAWVIFVAGFIYFGFTLLYLTYA